ncbi:UNVERIFIED_CONTAM: hypothetical protein FKN15_031837 [Acipenser sinensis]
MTERFRKKEKQKDVNRTDRTNTFYEGPDNPGLILLHDILMTYCMYDFDLESQDSGYLYFCFRWLLIHFKREFRFQDVLRLWEVRVYCQPRIRVTKSWEKHV